MQSKQHQRMSDVCSSGDETVRYVLNATVVAAWVQYEFGCCRRPFSCHRFHNTSVSD